MKDKIIDKYKILIEGNNKYKIIILLIVIILLFIFIIRYSLAKDEEYANIDISSLLLENNIIYFDNSNYSECKYCDNTKKYLDSNNIDYIYYDINSVSDSKLKNDLKLLDIDYELFGEPAIVYIEDNRMFANIININDDKVIEQFIKDYNLKKK